MRIESLTIKNFRAIKYLSLQNLKSTVVIAGPNGSGKSCVFDAIRLLKSAYGSHHQNEIQSFLGEFAISHGNSMKDWSPLCHDRASPIVIDGTFSLSETELHHLKDNIESILGNYFWSQVNRHHEMMPYHEESIAFSIEEHEQEINEKIKRNTARILEEIKINVFRASIEITKAPPINITPCPTLSLLSVHLSQPSSV